MLTEAHGRSGDSKPNHVVVDMTDDLQRSFQGNGGLTLNAKTGRVELFGTYFQVISFRSSLMP
jgi:hypothetical protein